MLAYPNLGEAINWLCEAFGFTLRLRIADHRAQLNAGDGAVVLTQESAAHGNNSHSLLIRVENVDLHHQRATRYGARVMLCPADCPYGERQYSVEDIAGHRWTFSQSIADVDPAEWGGTPGHM